MVQVVPLETKSKRLLIYEVPRQTVKLKTYFRKNTRSPVLRLSAIISSMDPSVNRGAGIFVSPSSAVPLFRFLSTIYACCSKHILNDNSCKGHSCFSHAIIMGALLCLSTEPNPYSYNQGCDGGSWLTMLLTTLLYSTKIALIPTVRDRIVLRSRRTKLGVLGISSRDSIHHSSY